MVFNSSYFFASCVLIQWVLRFILKCESVCSPNQKFNSSETMNVSLVRGALAPLSWQRFFSRVVNWCVSTSFIIQNDSGRMNRWSCYTTLNSFTGVSTPVRTNSTSSTAVELTACRAVVCIYCRDS